MVHRVGDDEVDAVLGAHLGRGEDEALGLVEDAGTAPAPALRLEIGLEVDDLVVGRVGHDEGSVVEGHDLARETEGRVGRGRRDEGVVSRLERAFGGVLLDELAHEGGQTGAVPLAGHRRDDVALGVDDDEGRPGASRVGAPRDELGVVEDGMVDGVALDRRGECVRVGLVLELGRVHPDDGQRVGVLRLDRTQLVEDVEAVDTAEGPEVENEDATPEVGQRQGPSAGVEPATADELGSPDLDPGPEGWLSRHRSRRSASTGKASRHAWVSAGSNSTLRTSSW